MYHSVNNIDFFALNIKEERAIGWLRFFKTKNIDFKTCEGLRNS